jgi:hypothetical protein
MAFILLELMILLMYLHLCCVLMNVSFVRDAKATRNSIPTRVSVDTKPAKDSSSPSENRPAAAGAPSRVGKKSTGLMGFSKTNTMTLGPRLKRLQRLRESGVLDMQEEKALVFNIMPSTPFEVRA